MYKQTQKKGFLLNTLWHKERFHTKKVARKAQESSLL